MNLKNKKGFTLVELLAVIVILAILVLFAAPRVLTMMTNTREKAFVTEADSIINGAELAYAQAVMDGGNQTCFPLVGYCSNSSHTTKETCTGTETWTIGVNEFMEKNFTDYGGSVKIDTTGSAHKIWVSNGSYSITNGTAGSLTLDGTTVTASAISNNCGV